MWHGEQQVIPKKLNRWLFFRDWWARISRKSGSSVLGRQPGIGSRRKLYPWHYHNKTCQNMISWYLLDVFFVYFLKNWHWPPAQFPRWRVFSQLSAYLGLSETRATRKPLVCHRCLKKCKVLGFTPFLDTPILAFEIFLRLGQFPQPSAPAFGAKNRLCGVAAGWTNIYFGDDQWDQRQSLKWTSAYYPLVICYIAIENHHL